MSTGRTPAYVNNRNFLRKRFAALSSHLLYYGMEYSGAGWSERGLTHFPTRPTKHKEVG